MDEEDTIPASYKPLPESCSETTLKYRWPVAHMRESYVPEEVGTSLSGPIKSSLKDPFLRYHRQTTYTDAFGEVKPFHIRGFTLQPCWLDPVGKNGNFYGESTYEEDYVWPNESSKMPRIPLKSTISWGILPLLGTGGNNKDIFPKKEIKVDDKKLESGFDKKKVVPVTKNKHPCKDFVPLQDIWSGATTYRRAFLNHQEGRRTKPTEPPVPVLKFSGNIELCTTAMRDYKDPKNMINFEAKVYIDSINWAELTVIQPPFTKFLDHSILTKCTLNPKAIDEDILPKIKLFPCQNQTIERCVKHVMEASSAVCGPLRRVEFIKTGLESRKKMPVFETKKLYGLL